jgi:hypothetical protein
MFWLMLEAALALALLIFIVWWTLPRKAADETTETKRVLNEVEASENGKPRIEDRGSRIEDQNSSS